MSQQGNFLGGFLLGTVVGGAVGGVIGALAASRLSQAESTAKLEGSKTEPKAVKKRPLKAAPEQNMEVARRGLEDKIAQLNDAIDDVRQQLGTVNGNAKESNREQTIVQEP
jgi:gas vesicle protein